MRIKPAFTIIVASFFCLLGYTNCSGSGFTAIGSLNRSSSSVGNIDYTGSNSLPIVVGTCGYVNAPCVSVTICTPGTSNCNTINNVLVDTGSIGLRLFASEVTVPLTAVTNSSGSAMGECQSYVGGSSDWGGVVRADIQLGGEKASNVPMQLIDASFGKIPTADCSNPDTSPSQAGFNGILGVGLFDQDCGATCVSTAVAAYYACTSSSCTRSTIPLANQTTNPVSLMPTDNNGVVIRFPAVATGGAGSVTGVMYLGVGTQTNNTVSTATAFAADSSGNFITIFNGATLSKSYIESGSNGMYFPAPSSLPTCSSSSYSSFYCPTSTTTLSATMKAASGSLSSTVNFQIGNTETMFAQSSYMVYPALGGVMSGSSFDWGLPFFIGRTVVIGIEGRSTYLGTGPFWAF